MIRKSEKYVVKIRAVACVIWCVVLWLVFRDVIDAPNWAAWAVTVIVWFELINQQWIHLLIERSVHEKTG